MPCNSVKQEVLWWKPAWCVREPLLTLLVHAQSETVLQNPTI